MCIIRQKFPSSIFLLFALAYHSSVATSTSFVRPVSQQWPWSQWTTTEDPHAVTTETSSDYNNPTWTKTTTPPPPPPVSIVPPRDFEKNLLIVTDPNNGRTFYIPANIFYERFGSSSGASLHTNGQDSKGNNNNPRNPFICDLYSNNCWLPTLPTTTTPYPQLRQSAFFKPTLSRSGTGVNKPTKMTQVDDDEELTSAASTWPWVQPTQNIHQNNWPTKTEENNKSGWRIQSSYYRPSMIPRLSVPPRRIIYQPTFTTEEKGSDDYDSPVHRHFFPLKKRDGPSRGGSGVGGTILCQNQDDCNDDQGKLH